MSCYYYRNKNGELVRYDSQMEVYEDFLKSTKELASNSIFSAEEVMDSTKKSLLAASSYQKYSKPEAESIYDFITTPHAEIFGNIEVLKGQSRLSPEFIQENRILEFVKTNLDKYTRRGNYNPEYLNMLKKDPILATYDDDSLIPALSEVEDRIRIEELTRDFSIKFTEWVQDIINGGDNFKNNFQKFFNENPEIFGDKVEMSVWQDRIMTIINTIISNLEGEPITSLYLVSLPNKSNNVEIKGKIGLATINSSGIVSIYDIRISKNKFEDWDNSKNLTYDWELALKKQLLGQHINIDETRLYIIPIEFEELQNYTKLTGGKPQNRTTFGKSGSQSGGQISSIAEILIPRQVKTKHDPIKISQFKENLNLLLFPDYKIKTEIEDNDLELLMQNAKRRFEETRVFKKYNSFKDIDGLPEGWVEETVKNQSPEEAERKFREKMSLYVNHVKTQEGRGTSIIKDAIISALASQQNIKTSEKSSKRDLVLNHLLIEYLNDDWEVLEGITEATALGIIPLRNTKTGVVNIFNLSVHNFNANSPIRGLSYGDVEMAKSMYFLNEFKDQLLINGTYKIGEIISFNTRSGDSVYRPSITVFNTFSKLMDSRGMSDQIKINTSDILGVEDLTLMKVMSVQKNYIGKHKESVEGIFSIIGNKQFDDITKEELIQIRNMFLEKFSIYKEKEIKSELNFEDQLEIIYALLQTAILAKEGIKTEGDFQDLTKLSIEAGDFRTLLMALYTKDEQLYTKAGKRIQGIVGGLAWTTPEWVQSKDLRQINSLISTGNSAIGERMVKFNDKMWNYTDEFYNSIGYGRIKQITFGETQSIHSEFFLIDENGKVNKEFRTKNPYINDVKNALSLDQRKYLKRTLLMINGARSGVSNETLYSINPEDEKAIKELFSKEWESGKYFEMPLVRREELTKYNRLFTGMGEWVKTFQDELKDMIDPRQLSEQDVENIEAQKVGFFEMYDAYGTQTKEMKAKMVDTNGVDYYEFNLDTIAHRVAFSKIRKQVFDMILPTVNAYMWWIKLMGGKQNKDVSKQLDYIVNQVKLAVFDEPLIGDEEQTLAQGIAFAKKISTTAMLAFRPVLLAKELSIGTMKNILAAGTGLYAEFGEKEMLKAYTKLLTIDKQFTNEFNMIDKLNHIYRIANMDISTVASKMQHDRYGLARGFGRWMFTTSTAADYYNRLAILLAKMIKDGSYEAHSMKGNELIYDATKDNRFSYYLSQREKYKDSNGNYINKKGDVKYNEQRTKYLLLMNQINADNALTGEKQYKESDLVDKAYSQKERNSIKAQSDLVYGSYDKDSQAQAPNTLLGIVFMQFLTYWPSKMKFWFGKRTKAEDSAIGKYEHAYKTDEQGNAIRDEKGELIYLYFKDTELEDGTLKREIVDYVTDEKVITWNGTPQEGLFLSMAYTVQDIFRGNWTELKNNKLRRNRTMFALGDSVFILILLGIIKAIFDGLKQDTQKGTVEGEILYFMDAVNNKVINEQQIWNNTFGAISTEPIFLSWGNRFASNFLSVVNDNKEFSKALGQSIGMFEMIK